MPHWEDFALWHSRGGGDSLATEVCARRGLLCLPRARPVVSPRLPTPPPLLVVRPQFIRAAGKAGVKLLSFSEGFVPGYPWWNWWTSTFDMDSNNRIAELYALNCAIVGTNDLDPIYAAAKDAEVNVVLPLTERDNTGRALGPVVVTTLAASAVFVA